MPRPFLSVQNITVQLQQHTLLQDLSFEVQPGEQWALVGESGSGKSSLLKTLAGKLPVVRGRVEYGFYDEFLQNHPMPFNGFTARDLVAEVELRHSFRSLSSNTGNFYYQQRYHASDGLDAPTVAEHLADAPALLPGPQVWTLEKVIHTFRLENLLQKQLIKLSNGETKRLLLATALLKNPRLLLLDMPLTGLDQDTRLNFDHLLSEIMASGVTVVLATSGQEIPASVTHVAQLHKGKIVSAGPKPSEMISSFPVAEPEGPDKAAMAGLFSGFSQAKFDTIVRLEDVTLRYGDKTILQNIYWHVRQGERWAVLGHNGAGKTTLLSLLNGDNPQAFSQNITLFDRRRGTGETLWELRSKIGFMSPELFQYFPSGNTCVQVVESGLYDTLGLFRKSVPEQEALALRWLAWLGIAPEAHKNIRSVSASTQRLCLLARALIKMPPLLILDEPCQGLDARQQQRIKSLLDFVCSQTPTTLLYVTHYPAEIPDCVTKVLRLEKGLVQAE